jgi:hypothetical protein
MEQVNSGAIMIEKKRTYLLRKVAGRFVMLDPQDFYDPRILNSSLMLESGRRVVVCDYKNKKYFSLPRLILNAQKGQIVDHINREPFDNRRENLRIVNARQSVLNRRLRSNTGFIGVSKTKRTDRADKFYYEAYFQPKDGKRKKFCASFTPDGLILAAFARDKFVLQAGDEDYAPLNFPFFKNEPFKSLLLKENLNDYKSGAVGF